MTDDCSLAAYYDLDERNLPSDLAAPVTVINFFELRSQAEYDDPDDSPPISGLTAMQRYGAVSGERLAAVGGAFVAQGWGSTALWGIDQAWDLVIVANYPSGQAFLDLLEDHTYRAAYAHRRAAVRRQRVCLSTTLPVGDR